ncbi:MAG: prolyl oligopeptidase family serine peptidase [Gemmataceae bacterium]|nr:prolyl oligopeptidase family serine peptidase [Gemmataceae bacterium]
MSVKAYEEFVRREAAQLRSADKSPTSMAEWVARAKQLRPRILEAVGGTFENCPLEPRILGEVKRPGYVIERLILQTQPDVWMTANLFRPDPAPKRGPAVLVVHGHWSLARVEPVVQSRCIGLVRLGFTVLCVDAFGSGERYSAPAPGTYHGGRYGGTLWPVGLSLLSLQLHDNRRALDYLSSRQEVDPMRIGVTGESGGGNQTMYAAAFDDRFAAAVPVCSVGNYQSYLFVQCCVCEVIPGVMSMTEEGDVLGLIAPRPLMVISAGRDSIQFSPAEAAKSVARARDIYRLSNNADRVEHAVFDAGHGYDKPMREAMYGWMTKWLKNEGAGTPISEPAITLEDPNVLRCYPDPALRPQGWQYPPTYAKRHGLRRLAAQFPAPPHHPEEWDSTATFVHGELEKVLGRMPNSVASPGTIGEPATAGEVTTTPITLVPEPGMPMSCLRARNRQQAESKAALLFVNLDGAAAAQSHPMSRGFLKTGYDIVAADHRVGGQVLPAKPGRVPDYKQAEHGVWIGRPLLGQWVFEVQCLLDWIVLQGFDKNRTIIAGVGSGALVALAAAALFPKKIAGAVLADLPVTMLTDSAYGDIFRMGALVPHLFRAGDVPQLAALVAPRPLVIAGGVDPQGRMLGQRELRESLGFPASVYSLLKSKSFYFEPGPDWDAIPGRFKSP